MGNKAKPKKRALRRHHTNRLKQKTKKIVKNWNLIEDKSQTETDRMVGRFHNNLSKCSCDVCCNPRKHGEKTIQERKMDLVEIDEWGDDTRLRGFSHDEEEMKDDDFRFDY